MAHPTIRVLLFTLFGLLTVGCGGPSLAPVSGTVTLGGHPVDGIRVIFEPIVGESGVTDAKYYTSFGITDAAGHYEMQTEVNDKLRPGAVVGTSVVRFVCTKRENFDNKGLEDSRAVHDLPETARDKSMRCTVESSGNTRANFDL
jgi:hypothetical protein